jgi:hypothetical protein
MHGEVEQQTFDAVERELIRKKLIRYMKENGIGAPTLAERIQDSHPRKTEIPLSTLQRFLAGWGKNESCVALCHRFVERVVISDPVAKLGERLSIFYGAGNGHDYSGNYISCPSLGDKFEDKIEIVAGTGFWRITERIAPYRGHAIYDGVLVSAENSAVVLLKNRLSGLARTYIVQSRDGYLRGEGATQTAFFLSDDDQKLFTIDRIPFFASKQR